MNSFIQPSLKKVLFILTFAVIVVGCNSQQATEVYAPDNKAINGYDPVAFFTESKPVKGSEAFTYQWKGADWNFASQQNLDSFKLSPEKYAPQYGGYCAYGTADGHKAPTKADTWTIVDGRLYFNYNNEVKDDWSKDRSALIKKADEAWPTVKLQE